MKASKPIIWQIGTRFESISLSPNWIGESIANAIEQLEKSNHSPALLILFQHTPDQFPRHEVEQLIANFPLTRLVSVYGSWCEGDGRNRTYLPYAIRVPIELGNQRIAQELNIILGQQSPLPITASRDEVFEATMSDLKMMTSRNSSIEVISPDRPFLEMVSDMLRTLGCQVDSQLMRIEDYSASNSNNTELIFVDVDPLRPTTDSTRFSVLKKFCADNQKTKKIALVGFAYPDLVEELQAIGFSHVLSKLYIGQQLAIV